MIIDNNGMWLLPESSGEACPSKGEYCRECEYTHCCAKEHNLVECLVCEREECPHALHKIDHLR